jgi:nucleotide-binding universal stress UspA family protein
MLARCSGAHVTLLRVVQPMPMAPAVGVDMGLIYPPIEDEAATNRAVKEATEQVDDVARGLLEQGSIALDAQVVVATSIAHAIIDFAGSHDVDLIAMSTHGRGASRMIMGSIADKVLRSSELPMLLHRPIGVSDAG